MKVCKGVKRDNTDHIPVAWEDIGIDTTDGHEYPIPCPVCVAIRCFNHDEKIILEMHNTALTREDYICKIEVQNTELQEKLIKGYDFTTGERGKYSNFVVDTITWEETPAKPSKKRSHKKKSNPEQEK